MWALAFGVKQHFPFCFLLSRGRYKAPGSCGCSLAAHLVGGKQQLKFGQISSFKFSEHHARHMQGSSGKVASSLAGHAYHWCCRWWETDMGSSLSLQVPVWLGRLQSVPTFPTFISSFPSQPLVPPTWSNTRPSVSHRDNSLHWLLHSSHNYTKSNLCSRPLILYHSQ